MSMPVKLLSYSFKDNFYKEGCSKIACMGISRTASIYADSVYKLLWQITRGCSIHAFKRQDYGGVEKMELDGKPMQFAKQWRDMVEFLELVIIRAAQFCSVPVSPFHVGITTQSVRQTLAKSQTYGGPQRQHDFLFSTKYFFISCIIFCFETVFRFRQMFGFLSRKIYFQAFFFSSMEFFCSVAKFIFERNFFFGSEIYFRAKFFFRQRNFFLLREICFLTIFFVSEIVCLPLNSVVLPITPEYTKYLAGIAVLCSFAALAHSFNIL